ncbi:hypothetical protein HU200_028011 [Digitaria exilis]|uniref:Uncharacterized protein n=1 Tax=Digitaria exilis TaxID=1010633 RepID=A0A835C6N7_9POAL|nr:hypothetical protein HU200_028011 [Digitaria exilis]CAB3451859.1 unnamed protein product [Digitaria exilis]
MYLPGLLPDDEEWCEILHQDVKKDVDHALAGRVTSSEALTAEAECQQLMEMLSANSNHEVVMNGMPIGKQLVKADGDQWEALACFWSEMILYVAPSQNLDGHAKAIASGGELITLLWVLLEHAGIVGRQAWTVAAP